MEQRTEEWFAARLGKVTASRMKDVMATIKSGEAAARKNYRAELVAERLTGRPADSYQSPAMLWGIEYEPAARELYEATTGNLVEQCGFIKHAELEAGASPDGLIDEDGIIEIKCPNTAQHISYLLAAQIPSEYVWQVQAQLWVTGRDWCHFVSYDPRLPEHMQLMVALVERDGKAIANLEVGVRAMLNEIDETIEKLEAAYGKRPESM